MADPFRTRYLYASPVVAVRDVRCRSCRSEAGGDECSTTDNIVFTRGGAFVRHVHGESAFGDANSILFFNRNEEYRVSHPIDGGDDCTVLVFAPDVLREALREADPSVADRDESVFPRPAAPADSRGFAAMQRLRSYLQGGTTCQVQAEESAMQVLAAVVRSLARLCDRPNRSARPDTVLAHRDTVLATRALLAQSFREPLALGEIAAAVHSSPFHLARVFQRETGAPIHRYLTRLRLRAALDRLAEGADDLSRLALDLGFSSHSHFSEAFRREFGLAPSTFRRGLSTARLRQMSKNLKV